MKPQTLAKPWGLPSVTISVNEMPATQFLQAVAYEAGVSLIAPNIEDATTITGEFMDQPAQSIFESIAEQLQKVAQYRDGVVTFVEPSQANRAFLVVRSAHLDQESALASLRAVLPDGANAQPLDDRIVITGDIHALQQAREFTDHWNTGPDGWLLDVRVVRLTQSMSRQLGIEWNATAIAGIDTTSATSTFNSDIIVQAIGRAIENGGDAVLLQKATLYLLEGQNARLNSGQRVPIPRFTTSPEGTTTTAGYDYIDAGFTLDAIGYRVPTGIRLQLTPSISSVTGFVGDAPITQDSTVQVSAVLESGQWMIISGLDTTRESLEETRLPGLPSPIFGQRTDSNENTRLLVLVNAQRVYTTGQPTP